MLFRKKQGRSATSNYLKVKRGRRPDLGDIFFRSKWEANYARYLNLLKVKGHIHKWEFEPDTFWFEKILRGVKSYTPDFKVWMKENEDPIYVEVKGYMDKKSLTKLKRLKKYHPHIELNIVSSKDYLKIQKDFSKMIPTWEE